MLTRNIVIIFILMLTVQCHRVYHQTANDKILTGWLSEQQLLRDFPTYIENKNDYQPNTETIAQLNQINKKCTVLIFLGTYCLDSEREVPRFLKIIDILTDAKISYKLFGLDRASADKSGMRGQYHIEYIPTFIVYVDGQEVSRIIESPTVNLEHDMLEILNSF